MTPDMDYFSLFDSHSAGPHKVSKSDMPGEGYALEIVGSQRAFAFARADAIGPLTLLYVRREWTCPQLDEVIAKQAKVFRGVLDKAKQSRRYLLASSDSARAAVLSPIEDAVGQRIPTRLPIELLRMDRAEDPAWLAQLVEKCPSLEVLECLVFLAKQGPYSALLRDPRREAAYSFIWAMGWAKSDMEIEPKVALKALSQEVLQRVAHCFGMSTSGTKETLARRILDKVGIPGLWSTQDLMQPLQSVYALADGIILDANVLRDALQYAKAYTAEVLRAFARKPRLSPSVLKSTGFLELDTSACRSVCQGKSIPNPYDPVQFGLPPFDLLCQCRVRQDDDSLSSALNAARSARGEVYPLRKLNKRWGTRLSELRDSLSALLDEILESPSPKVIDITLQVDMWAIDRGNYDARGALLIDVTSKGAAVTVIDYRSYDQMGAIVPLELERMGWEKEEPGLFTNWALRKQFKSKFDVEEVARFCAEELIRSFQQDVQTDEGPKPATSFWETDRVRFELS